MKAIVKLANILSIGMLFFVCGCGTHRITVRHNNTMKALAEVNVTILKSIKIGEQEWMAENLNVDRFQNGDSIPEAKSNEEWKRVGEEGKPAWCYCGNNNDKKYGKFYNWYAVDDERGLAPEGWHIPSLNEFRNLWDVVKDGNALKAIGEGSGNGVGTNTSGFSALMANFCDDRSSFKVLKPLSKTIDEAGPIWTRIQAQAYFWSSTKPWLGDPVFMCLYYSNGNFYIGKSEKEYGFNVRCVKD